MNPHPRKQSGFTLIELLVAMSIFAIVSLLTWQGFSTLIHHYQRLSRELQALQQWELGMAQLKKDLLQIPYPPPDPLNTMATFEGDPRAMAFFTLGQQGRLAHVTYLFSENTLERKIQYAPWDKAPIHRVILHSIKQGQFHYIVDRQRFSQQKGLPDGIQCQFFIDGQGEVSRIMALRATPHE